MGQRSRRPSSQDTTSFAILIIGVVVVGLILSLMVRFQKGMLGLVLGAAAAGLLIFWLRELKKGISKPWLPAPSKKKEWTYEIMDVGHEVNVITEVPGPEDQIRVELSGKDLEIYGGSNFRKILTLPRLTEISTITYVNGVLNVKLKTLVEEN